MTTTIPMTTTMIGRRIGNYRITGLLGQGGMGQVYLAEHPNIGRKAAIKILLPELVGDPETLNRFFNEARASTATRHPGIVEIFDSGIVPEGGLCYIIMEYLDGESLRARIQRKGRLPQREAVDIACQVSDALSAAHGQGIIHRDLKPDNLHIVPNPSRRGEEMVKVLDFGVAKLGEATLRAKVQTRTGTILGTPIYMSPEQCRGNKQLDLRSDVYALGIILYEMLNGRPPFVSEGFGELAYFHISAAPPSLRERDESISEELEAVVMRMLAKEPEGRFATMDAVSEALRACPVATASITSTLPGLPSPLQFAVVEEYRVGSPKTTFSSTARVLEAIPDMRSRAARWRPLAMAGVVGMGLAAGILYLAVPTVSGTKTMVGAGTAPVTAPHAVQANARPRVVALPDPPKQAEGARVADEPVAEAPRATVEPAPVKIKKVSRTRRAVRSRHHEPKEI